MTEPIQYLERSWKAYQERYVARECPSELLEMQHLAFYGGIDSLIRLMALHLGNGDPLGYTPSDLAFMTGIAGEMAHYLRGRIILSSDERESDGMAEEAS